MGMVSNLSALQGILGSHGIGYWICDEGGHHDVIIRIHSPLCAYIEVAAKRNHAYGIAPEEFSVVGTGGRATVMDDGHGDTDDIDRFHGFLSNFDRLSTYLSSWFNRHDIQRAVDGISDGMDSITVLSLMDTQRSLPCTGLVYYDARFVQSVMGCCDGHRDTGFMTALITANVSFFRNVLNLILSWASGDDMSGVDLNEFKTVFAGSLPEFP